MLSDVRVLEISAPGTMLAGQILGDLGADVVTLEPPGGASGRRLGPYVDGRPGLERGLTWHALNRNKRGMTLDRRSADGRAILADLIKHFDVLIEWVDEVSCLEGLERPETLVVCEISAFSRTGPKSRYAWTDAVLSAAGGAPALSGDADRAPLFFPVPQAMMEAGAEAAVAALAGLSARDRLDVAQTVHVQTRVAAMMSTLGRMVVARSGDRVGRRGAPRSIGAMPVIPGMYECADGWVTITVAFLAAFVAMTQRIAQWLVVEGELPPEIAGLDLYAAAQAAMKGDSDGSDLQALADALARACKRKTKAELIEISRTYRFMAAPAMTMADIAAFEHYRERGLFAPQTVGDKVVDAPARFAQFSDYEIGVRRPAPALSEHTVEILTVFAGLSEPEVQALFGQGVI